MTNAPKPIISFGVAAAVGLYAAWEYFGNGGEVESATLSSRRVWVGPQNAENWGVSLNGSF